MYICIAYALTHLNFSKWQHRHFNIFHKQTLSHLQSNSIAESIGIRFEQTSCTHVPFWQEISNTKPTKMRLTLCIDCFLLTTHFIGIKFDYSKNTNIQFAAFCLHFFFISIRQSFHQQNKFWMRVHAKRREKKQMFSWFQFIFCVYVVLLLFCSVHEFIGGPPICWTAKIVLKIMVVHF